MDEVTRTARMIVEVPGAVLAADRSGHSPDAAPTISIGMDCRAELPGEPLLDAVLIPRHAVHEDRWVYVFESATDGDHQGLGRLARREVSMLRMIGDEVLIDYRGHDNPRGNWLESDELLVVSRVADPVPGMQVALNSALDSAPNEWARPSSIVPAEFASLGNEQARMAMSDSASSIQR